MSLPADPAGWREFFAAAHARVGVPRNKRVYRVTLGGGVMSPVEMWEWRCPVCPYQAREHDKGELEVRIRLHRCRPSESASWHPRYRMPPRYGR